MPFSKLIIIIVSFIITVNLIAQNNYQVTISHVDDDIYEINYGEFYVELFCYKYCYGETVVLKTNNITYSGKFYATGEICWEEREYNYYTNEYNTTYSDCYSINKVFEERSCSDCKSLNGSNVEEIDKILVPVELSSFVQ